MKRFQLTDKLIPKGDQPTAIKELINGFRQNKKKQVLLGVTGSGKTFTIANVIANQNKNTLVISHNKTLAAQLYSEFKEFFPNNNVGYFVSFYDYYQPESYIPQSDTYIEKDTEINEKIEQLRLEATSMLLSGEPTIIIATVSCIYSLGSPQEWRAQSMTIAKGAHSDRRSIIQNLVRIRYQRNDIELKNGTFRVKGDIIEIVPGYSNDIIKLDLFGSIVEKISVIDKTTKAVKKELDFVTIFPAKHYIVDDDRFNKALDSIKTELKQWLPQLPTELERQRLLSRTTYDLEMLSELGYCNGIENYSRYFDGRKPNQPAYCLLDFFDKDFLLVIDESHVTLPQIMAMYKGDYSRKKSLVDYGFRLPSAFDNRPLKFEEFEKYLSNVIYVSATPGRYELNNSNNLVEQLVRPTGLVDPEVEIKKTTNQMSDLINQVHERISKQQRTLITTLTKKMAEDMADYLAKNRIKVRYIHSEIKGLERTELLRKLRIGEFDVLVGINLLREGLDLPEVALVVILDADKEGFLRNYSSLIQTFGRAARNIDGKVILYSDTVTKSMKEAVLETNRRRKKQIEYNLKNNIIPTSILKPIPQENLNISNTLVDLKSMSRNDLIELSTKLEIQMNKYAEELEFEKAIEQRENLQKIKQILLRQPIK
ncbi:excinuclease ABC subunit UvrB [Candidatus Nitrosocosmicus franklandus]|uniref:UvrABC system protein B n=1 Tax=Candidatus Nitrosocosmicus franklandianus TaxID=1798806 RepID=A0A484IG91_9ARCH|nr:excinuclease ABC subunit UvrB [Candidatus Nitrosocosmicus franklandus]VFJ15031.1 UvrABC system protein B [Candidatus Nitrosocosmicus franklandus]